LLPSFIGGFQRSLCRIILNRQFLVFVLAALLPWSRLCDAQTALSSTEAVNFALSHRPELRAATDRVSGSEHLRAQAGLIPNPHFLFRKEDLRPQTSAFGESSQTYWEGAQLLEISGKRGGRIAVANQSIEQSRLEVDLDRRQIALSVRESYWKAKAMQALADLYDENAKYFQQVIDYHEARFHEGKIAEIDLLRVRLQGQQIRAAAANARLDSEKAILMLAQEMNAASNSAWVLSDDLETLEEPRPIPPGSDASALRTEAQIAQQSIAQAKARTQLERATGRPDLLFTGGYKRDLNLDAPLAGVQFELPLFNRNQGAVAASRAEEDAATETYQATRNRLAAELALAQREYEMRREQYLQVFKPLRNQAIEISDISRAAYQAGGLDLLRLLDAERARVDAELTYVRALEGFHLSVVALNYAEGMDQ
jgi:outer membrane protein, heavy metal efflux system